MPGDWVGRGPELAAIDAALSRLATGTGGALAVSGEPGIGKTRLLAEAGARAEARGCLVLEGQATELERDFPFGVVVDALDTQLAALAAPHLRGLSGEQRRLLAAVFPALAGHEGEGALPAEERFRAHRAVRELLALLGRTRPLVLVLDDLHWADAASLELLDHLLRRPPAAPVLLLLAQRTGAPLGPLARVGERIELGPLTSEEAERLMGEDVPARTQARLYAETGGNPFHLEHLTRAWRRDGTAADAAVPRPVEEALAAELAGLDPETQRVLQGAAAAGDPFTPEEAAEVAGEDPARALAALDRAIAVRLVRGTETPVLFRFRHPLARKAVYASAGEAWRVGAHARAAALLARHGAGPLTRAHHLERSAVRGDEDAVGVLTAAGQAAAAVAPASAARWCAAALRLLPEDAEDGRRVALLGPLAAALGSAGRLHESRARLLEILDLLPAGLGEARGRVTAFLARIDHLLGRNDDARRLLEQTLADVSDQRSADAARLELELAAHGFFLGDWTALRAHAERGWDAAADVGDRGLRATGAALLGHAEYCVGRLGAARERLAEAVLIVDGPERDGGGASLDALDWLGWFELKLEEYDAARQHFTRAVEVARRDGGGHLLASLTFGLVLGSAWSSRLGDALEHSDASLELARLLRSDRMLSWALGLRTLVQLRRGAVGEALVHGEEARRLGAGLPANTFFAVMGGWFGEALIEAGRPARGREEILLALGGPGLPGIEAAYRPYFYDVLTGAEVVLGRREAAAEWARVAEETARGLGLPGRTGAALHAAALVAEDPDEGAELALGAAAEFATGHPVEAGRARVLAGRRLGEAGNREEALAELRRAGTELTALGARHHAAQAVRERRRLGEHVARGGRRGEETSGLASLSGREREVAALVEERLSNREIAERLVLSEKTVERHLSRIFVKLGARSRVDVARALETAGG